jgi:hypothetical protein
MLAFLRSTEPSKLWGDASLDVANAFDDGTSGRIQSIKVQRVTIHMPTYSYSTVLFTSYCGALRLQHVDSTDTVCQESRGNY